MSIALALLRKYWPALVALAVLAGALTWSHHAGYASANADWQSRWDQHMREDAQAQRDAEEKARNTEHTWQMKLNEVQSNGEKQLEDVQVAADAGRADSERLRAQLADLQRKFGGGAKSAVPGASSASATRAAIVLSDLLSRCSSERQVIAEFADRSRVAGLACEASYDGLRK